MKRRTFIKNAAIAMSALSISPSILSAKEPFENGPEDNNRGNDFEIVKDETVDNIRYVSATPSSIVCSARIDIEIEAGSGIIRYCKFTRGCPGNAIGLCKLVVGMKKEEVIAKLFGTPCATKGTSCPDQLARILSSLK